VLHAWQDILRRYLLLSRQGLLLSKADLQAGGAGGTAFAELSDDMAAVQVVGVLTPRPFPAVVVAVHWHGTHSSPCHTRSLPHSLTAQAAVRLGRAPYWRLPPALHLRLLNVLVTDALQARLVARSWYASLCPVWPRLTWCSDSVWWVGGLWAAGYGGAHSADGLPGRAQPFTP
jgi:hypothetical protein